MRTTGVEFLIMSFKDICEIYKYLEKGISKNRTNIPRHSTLKWENKRQTRHSDNLRWRKVPK